MLGYFLDGNALIYRSILMPQEGADLRSPSGEPTGGIYSFTLSLLKILRERRPTHFAVAMDAPRDQLKRRKWYEGYKKRKSVSNDESFFVQLRRCEQVIKALGLRVVQHPEWEGDDVLATLARMTERAGGRAVMVGSDKDLHQVISRDVSLFDPYKTEFITPSVVLARWGVPPKQVVEVQALAGDPTDKVPGVKGIGLGQATALIQRFGTAKAVHENRHLASKRQCTALGKADIDLCLRLVRLRTKLDLGVTLEGLAYRGLDMDRARPLFKELGFKRLALPPANYAAKSQDPPRVRRNARRASFL